MQEWTFQAIATVANAALAIILVSWRSGPKRPRTFWIAVSCCVVLVGAQVGALYQRYIHDSEVAARLDLKSSGDIVFAEDTKFDSLKKERSEAASAILKFLRDGNWNSMTDREEDSLGEVLSFLDELGHLWKTRNLNVQDLHEYFYDDLRMYCQETLSYIDEQRRTLSPSYYENIEPLLNAVTAVEVKKTGRSVAESKWDKDVIQASLKSELRFSRKSGR